MQTSKMTCFYGAEKCWFRHKTVQQENNQNGNCEITSKLFDMKETFTNRIMKIEKQIEITNQ